MSIAIQFQRSKKLKKFSDYCVKSDLVWYNLLILSPITVGEIKQRLGDKFVCPECRAEYSGDFPVCRLTENLRNESHKAHISGRPLIGTLR